MARASGQIIDGTYTTVATVGDQENAAARPARVQPDLARDGARDPVRDPQRRPVVGRRRQERHRCLSATRWRSTSQPTRCCIDWVSIDHVGLDESYQPLPRTRPATAYDYFHINSIAEASDGNLLISGRNTWAVYKVHRQTGEVMWRLNGKKSDFESTTAPTSPGSTTCAPTVSSQITIFDNANISGHASIGADARPRRAQAQATPAQACLPASGQVPGLDARQRAGPAQRQRLRRLGRAALLLRVLTRRRSCSYDGQFDGATRSYRTFLADWHGRPTDKPAMVARSQPAEVGS